MRDATTIQEIEDHPWPDMDDPTRVAHVAAEAARLAEETEYAMATPWLLFPLERAFAMQSMETFLMNLAIRPDFAEALLWKLEEHWRMIRILAPAGGYMVSSVHTVMNDVPAENVLAMVDAVEEFGTYPIAGTR